MQETIRLLPRDMIVEILRFAAMSAEADYRAEFATRYKDFMWFGSRFCGMKSFLTIESPWAGIGHVCRAWSDAYRTFAARWPEYRFVTSARCAIGCEITFGYNKTVVDIDNWAYIWLGDLREKYYATYDNLVVMFDKNKYYRGSAYVAYKEWNGHTRETKLTCIDGKLFESTTEYLKFIDRI
jgi:hypothetical protein